MHETGSPLPLEVQGVPLVRFLYCDNAGVIRGKSIPRETLEFRLRGGIGCTVAMQAVTVTDELVEIPEMGVVGEFRLIPDTESLTMLPYVAEAAMLCDMVGLDQQPWGACPRSFLKRMQERLSAHGFIAQVGIEHEFHLLRQEGRQYMPADDSPLFGTEGLDQHRAFLQAALDVLTSARIKPVLLHAEYGPGQLELSMAPAQALRTADQICLTREMLRGVARSAGLLASFAPKPFPDQMAGNGAHLHVSLWNHDQLDTNLFYDAREPGSLSQLGRFFLAGMLAHLPALVALTCGSVNSYQRLGPHTWSSAYSCWGFDHREAAIRVCSPFWGQEQASLNLEVRCSDHSGNPYLAIGALLAAGLDGIERRLEPAVPLSVDPSSLSEAEREQRGIRRLPHTLTEALDALVADSFLLEALGSLLAASYLAVKRAEVATFQGKSPEEIASAHLRTY